MNAQWKKFDGRKSSNMYRKDNIKAVMPIEKPEYPITIGSDPKEVG